MMAVASVEGQVGRGVVNAVVWRGVGWVGYEYSVSRYRATLSLNSRANTVNDWNFKWRWDIHIAEGSATFAYLKGLKSSLMCTTVVFLIGIPKKGFGFADSVGFGFGDWLAADGPVVVAGETLCGES